MSASLPNLAYDYLAPDGQAALMMGDCLELLPALEDLSIDLVLTSPPYEDARTYGIGFGLKGQAWVDWAKERFILCHAKTMGLTAWVVEGRTRNYSYSATPYLLAADLHRAGVPLRKPPIYMRNGIPGSGGPDWLKNNYEPIICASHGKLPWSDNTAMGHKPKFGVGGSMTNRQADGSRKGFKRTKESDSLKTFRQPDKANPGNTIADPCEADEVINCGSVGGGNMGSDLCHENEAPFPEYLAEFFIRSFCLPGGIVLDPFCGSGTTLAVARRLGRKAIGFDVRDSQIELSIRRIEEVTL